MAFPLQMETFITQLSLSGETYREIVMPTSGGTVTVYRIDTPQVGYISTDGTNMAIVDGNGLVHDVPMPGYEGAVHRWEVTSGSTPVPSNF